MLRTIAVVAAVCAVINPAPQAATAATIDDYKAIAAKWLPFLPAVPAGWKRTEPSVFVSNSAFQKAMEVRSIYRKEAGQGQIGIFIGAKPGFMPDYRQKAFDDEATAKKQGFEYKMVDGRKWLVRKKAENLGYTTLLERGIVVVLAGKWVQTDDIEALLPKFDYAAIAAVN